MSFSCISQISWILYATVPKFRYALGKPTKFILNLLVDLLLIIQLYFIVMYIVAYRYSCTPLYGALARLAFGVTCY